MLEGEGKILPYVLQDNGKSEHFTSREQQQQQYEGEGRGRKKREGERGGFIDFDLGKEEVEGIHERGE